MPVFASLEVAGRGGKWRCGRGSGVGSICAARQAETTPRILRLPQAPACSLSFSLSRADPPRVESLESLDKRASPPNPTRAQLSAHRRTKTQRRTPPRADQLSAYFFALYSLLTSSPRPDHTTMSGAPSAHKTDAPATEERPVVYKSNLEDFEREGDVRLPFLLSYREVKLLGIAGVRLSTAHHTTTSHRSLPPRTGWLLPRWCVRCFRECLFMILTALKPTICSSSTYVPQPQPEYVPDI